MSLLLPADDMLYTTPLDDQSEFSVEVRYTSPAHLLLKIESFSLLSENGIKRYESRAFSAGGYGWKLIIYPDGHKIENEGEYVSVYLAMVKNREVNANFSFFLFNQSLDNYLCFRGKMRRFQTVKSEWGFSKLIPKKSFTNPSNGYLIDDNCVFGAEVFVVKSRRVIEQLSVHKVTNPYKLDWKISEISKIIKAGNSWTSGEFSAGDYEWKIKLDMDRQEKQNIDAFLYVSDPESFSPQVKVKADFTLRIRNQLGDNDHFSVNASQWFSSSNESWVSSEFITIADIKDPAKGFILDDCCILEAEISIQAVASDGVESDE